MTNEEIKMIETLEEARKASENPNPFKVYAFSNGHRITYLYEYNVETLRNHLENDGFWICSIFENGHRVEA